MTNYYIVLTSLWNVYIYLTTGNIGGLQLSLPSSSYSKARGMVEKGRTGEEASIDCEVAKQLAAVSDSDSRDWRY